MTEPELYCINHPDRAALEKCEVCGKPLCGYCLYYTEDGQRLCEQHAQLARQNGLTVIPPAVYASGIIPSQADASRQAKQEEIVSEVIHKKGVRYQGNDNDLLAFLSMTVGLITLSSCCGAFYCLPFGGLLLGIIALMNAKDSINPRRARQHAWIGIGTGGCFVIIVLAIIAIYVFSWGAFLTTFNTSSSSNIYNLFPTNTVTPAPTYTASHTVNPNLEPSQLTATARPQENGLRPLNLIFQTATAKAAQSP